MTPKRYLRTVKKLKIEHYGFDTHARVLGINKEEVKRLWNAATNNQFKRMPRTEYTLLYRPELSNQRRSYWQLSVPSGFLMFYLTPTTPVIIPDGFLTDKGSIPIFFRNIVAHDDRDMILAFFIHDLECEMTRMTRFTIDGLLYEVGTEMGANWFKKNIIYTAVRAAAWIPTKDRIRGGINISAANRKLIHEAEKRFIEEYLPKHLKTIT